VVLVKRVHIMLFAEKDSSFYIILYSSSWFPSLYATWFHFLSARDCLFTQFVPPLENVKEL
jgi:hypothetical protein